MDREEFLEKARKANEDMAKRATLSDLANKDSIIYSREGLKIKPTENPVAEAPRERQTVDAEGLPVLERVHTFAEDIQDAVAEKGLSLSRIAMEEGKAAAEKEPVQKEPFPWQKVILIVLAVFFVTGGLALGVYSYFKKKEAEITVAPVVEVQKKDFIEVREAGDVTPRRPEKRFLLEAIENELKVPRRIDSFKKITLKNSEGKEFDTTMLLESLEAAPPDTFLRSLSQTFYLYTYRSNEYSEPVLLLFASSFETAYPGMLEWEHLLPQDMEGLYGFEPKSATTTEKVFKDRIIENKDVRVFYNPDGTFKFFYSIVEDRIIVFAKSPNAFKDILKRIREAKIIGQQ